MNGLSTWLADFRWAMNMKRARAWRRDLGFAERMDFDRAFRPRVKGEPGLVFEYPDAAYHTTIDDLLRAMIFSRRPS